MTLSDQIAEIAETWSRCQYRLVTLAAEFADSTEWSGISPTAAQWLAEVVDIEVSTAREWIRVGRRLRQLPTLASAFESGELSYSKVRLLTRIAEPKNEAELVRLATTVPASDLANSLASWFNANGDPDEIAELHHVGRSVTHRIEPDGMVLSGCRLPPLLGAKFVAALDAIVMRRAKRRRQLRHGAPADAWPTLAQQRADALDELLDDGGGISSTEIVIHVRGDGYTMDDGTPIPARVVERIAPDSFIRALIHDAEGRPINASSRRRHPTDRQKRVVKERDRVCVDCGSNLFGQYDHNPPHEQTGHTTIEELELRCSSCHRKRHRGAAA